MTLTPLFNSDPGSRFTLPPDGWYHIVPVGEFAHPKSGQVQVLDACAMKQMASRFTQEKQRPNFPGLRIDKDHFSYASDKDSTAYGWITELANRDTGLWAQVRWTTEGESLVKDGSYRYISPVWLSGDTQDLGNGRIRPLRLDSLGLTNNPNLRGMVPLSNRAPQASDCGLAADASMRSAARLLLQTVAALKSRDQRRPLSEAYHETALANRRLEEFCRLGPGPIANSSAGAWSGLSEDIQRALSAAEPGVRGRLRHQLEVHKDYWKTISPAEIRQRIASALSEIMGARGLSFDAAWEALKQSDPIHLAQFVISDTSGGAVQLFPPLHQLGGR